MSTVRSLIIHNDAILLLGAYNSKGVHRFELPGGNIEKYQTIVTAAVAENKEETDLDTMVKRMLGWYDSETKGKRVYLVICEKIFPRQNIKLEPDFDSHLWLPIKSDFTLPLAPSSEYGIRKLWETYRKR